MKNEFDNEHFRGFAKSLELAIGQYGGLKEDEDNTARQKRQIETLIGLEREFRKLLGSHPEGMKAVEKFIHFICEERRNILDARPYFRERYGVFVSDISPAFKNRNAKTLIKFDVNYQFVHFIVKTGEWKQSGPGSRLGKEILRIERDIKKIRTELIEMNMPLAISRAKIFLGRNKRAHLDYMDLIQVAAEGLISAVDKFCLPYTPVFRSVIIGRIVGNAIEENSKTMLHFFPSDKRKLYRANKAVGRSPSEEVDLDRIVKFVNEGSGVVTNQTEIRDLMSAASVVSADSTTPASGGDGDSVQRSVDSFASPEEGRPDVIAEHEDAVSAVALASQALSYLEQKLLRLKGISFV